jgi:outer membrane protein OmpA-like peptidoglycan-associated protein
MAQSLFPNNPVPMRPGYGAEGQGLHYGIPFGVPGNDCVINPVSMTKGYREVEVVKMVPGDIITIPANVLFDFDKSFVRPEGNEVLQSAIYSALVKYGVTEIEVIGHTDAKGTEEYNQALGLRRATAVGDALVALGFPEEGVTYGSGGELSPIAPNTFEDGSDNPEGRQLNRRVELIVKAVEDKAVTVTEGKFFDRNPQIFHRFTTGNTVLCESQGFGNGNLTRFWLWQ